MGKNDGPNHGSLLDSSFPRTRESRFNQLVWTWIPAYAGMTTVSAPSVLAALQPFSN